MKLGLGHFTVFDLEPLHDPKCSAVERPEQTWIQAAFHDTGHFSDRDVVWLLGEKDIHVVSEIHLLDELVQDLETSVMITSRVYFVVQTMFAVGCFIEAAIVQASFFETGGIEELLNSILDCRLLRMRDK